MTRFNQLLVSEGHRILVPPGILRGVGERAIALAEPGALESADFLGDDYPTRTIVQPYHERGATGWHILSIRDMGEQPGPVSLISVGLDGSDTHTYRARFWDNNQWLHSRARARHLMLTSGTVEAAAPREMAQQVYDQLEPKAAADETWPPHFPLDRSNEAAHQQIVVGIGDILTRMQPPPNLLPPPLP
jgi:hypothetical protein